MGFLRTKEITENIIPAIFSTTASITGLHVFKYIIYYKPMIQIIIGMEHLIWQLVNLIFLFLKKKGL